MRYAIIKCYLSIALGCLFTMSYSQTTNIFPANGYVGVGTLTQQAALDIYGLIQISAQNSGTPSSDLSYGLFPYGGVGLGMFSGATNANQGIGMWTNPSGVRTEVMRILSGGNVGIGTITPSGKLSVNGKIRTKEIKVETANWPDYVFLPSYKIPTLIEIEKYIKENGHLPWIPSAVEVEKNGVELCDISSKLLQKIEELTLHLIEKDKIITGLLERVDKLETRNK